MDDSDDEDAEDAEDDVDNEDEKEEDGDVCLDVRDVDVDEVSTWRQLIMIKN